MIKTGLRKLNDVTKKYKELLLKDIESKTIVLETVEQCICCKNKTFEKLLDVDRFDLPFGTYICKDCGLVTTSPRIKEESLPYYYEKYYHPLNYGKESLENQVALFKEGQGTKIFNLLKPYINEKKINVLEIGAGIGNVLDEFKQEANIHDIDVTVLGTEYSMDCIKQCEHRNIPMIEGNAKSVLSTNQTFDIIILSHVFEHFIHLEEELNILKQLLNKDGLLYIEVPGILKNHNKDYYDFSFLGYSVHAHMYNFSLHTLSNILNKHSFSLLKGNEEVEAIFQINASEENSITNDYSRIKQYLEFLEDNQEYALKQNKQIKDLTSKTKDLSKYKLMVENRDKDLSKYKFMVKNRDKDLSKYKLMVESKDKKLTDINKLLENIHEGSIMSLFKNKSLLIEIKKIIGD